MTLSTAPQTGIFRIPSFSRFGEAAVSVMASFRNQGIDVAPVMRCLARAAFSVDLAAMDEKFAIAQVRDPLERVETEIDDCYRMLRQLPSDSEEHARTLRLLRNLQESEAQSLGATFKRRIRLDSAAAQRALDHADQLLAAYEDPAHKD